MTKNPSSLNHANAAASCFAHEEYFVHDSLLRDFLILITLLCYLSFPHTSSLAAKATFQAIGRTYTFLTPDLWEQHAFEKSPYQEHTDFLAKHHKKNVASK